MMYGFGDDQNPYTESVDLLEDLVVEFIIETTHRWADFVYIYNIFVFNYILHGPTTMQI